jgi:hypothetical protein
VSYARPDEEATSTAAVPSSVDAPREPDSGWWFLQLLFSPTAFFQRYAMRPPAAVVAAAAVVVGVVATMDRVDRQMMKADIGGRGLGAMSFVVDSWAGYWAWCLGVGAVMAVVVAYLGGWWYRARLKMSGAVEPDAGLARRVYLFSYQVEAVPALLYAAFGTLVYATPADAWYGDDLGAFALLGFGMWSLFVSYKGARACFDVSRGRALFWFAIAPGALLMIALATIVAVYAAVGAG